MSTSDLQNAAVSGLTGPLEHPLDLGSNTSSPVLGDWKGQLLNSLSSVEALEAAGLITSVESAKLRNLPGLFKIRVTPYYAKLMRNDPLCPIRRQAIPDLDEVDPILPDWATQASQEVYGRAIPWDADAIGDVAKLVAPRMTHRYEDRAIIHLSSMCAVYCRFCFRKSHLGAKEKQLYEGSLEPAFQYLGEHPEIHEVILTGGDPLSVSDAALEGTLDRLAKIPSIRTVRLHSRMAVTLPARFSAACLKILSQDRGFGLVLVSHFNHPTELSVEALEALKLLRRSGVTLLNQSVLLRGVNDSLPVLRDLFVGLYEAGVLPYYLHHPDWTPGTFHFRMSISEGLRLVRQLRGRVPGPALPDYVLDLPQGHGKTSLLGSDLEIVTEWSDGPVGGALYQLRAPATRSAEGQVIKYLDLFGLREGLVR